VRGSIRKRATGRWEAVADVTRGPDGSRRRAWKTFDTRREAAAWISQTSIQVQEGTFVERSGTMLSTFLESWIRGLGATRRASTVASYETLLRVHVIPQIGGMKLQAIRTAHLRKLQADLLTSGRRDGKGLSPRSVAYVMTVLGMALGDAMTTDGLLARNPARGLPRPKNEKRRDARPPWSPAEAAKFLDATNEDRIRALWHVALTTGMRRGELLGLRWTDVDLDAGRLLVARSLVKAGNEVQISDPKTEKSTRTIALDPRTVQVLRDHHKRQAEERLAWGPAYRSEDLVFAREKGDPFHPDGLSGMFEAAVKRAGLPRIRFHDLRHVSAALAIRAGVHAKVLSERLGHSSIAITMDVYGHLMGGLDVEAAAGIAAVLNG
jgi:integrase